MSQETTEPQETNSTLDPALLDVQDIPVKEDLLDLQEMMELREHQETPDTPDVL